MNFRTRLLLLNLLGCLLPVVVLGTLQYRSVRADGEQLHLQALEGAAAQNARLAGEWLKRLDGDLASAARSVILREAWQRLVHLSPDDDESFPVLYGLQKNLSLMVESCSWRGRAPARSWRPTTRTPAGGGSRTWACRSRRRWRGRRGPR